MASLHRDNRTGNWIIAFRWGGRQYKRSCKTDSRIEARAIEARVEETIRLLEQGRLEIPTDADPAVWVMSGGKIGKRHRTNKDRLGDICESYLKDQLDKADTTRATERIHVRHLNRVLGERTTLDKIDLRKLQHYVSTRHVSGTTIRKELVTFTQIWGWAKVHKLTSRECPVYDDRHQWAVKIPKPNEREKFMTWDEIERRGDPELWKYLFLDETQVGELLQYVEKSARHKFIHPMFVFTVYTGARRSEILRSEVKDFDFESGKVRIRERKRRKDKSMSFRTVQIHPTLRKVMESWFVEHPGGCHTISRTGKRMTGNAGSKHFSKTLEKSRWEVVRGFHVLRHSFGSNLARNGRVRRETIAAWMGHTTEEMITLYQHLFPQDWHEEISVLA